MKTNKKIYSNKLVIVLFILFLFTNSSCIGSKITGNGKIVEEKREITDFTKIEVSSIINVELTQADNYDILIKTDENLMEYIITEEKNGVLYIRCIKKFSNIEPTKLIVYVSLPNLESLKTSGASVVSMKNNFELKDFECDFSGASDIKLNFTAINFECDISGASDVFIKSKHIKNNIEISGASDIDFEFTTEQTKLDISGASDITLKGRTTNLDIQLSGASDLDAYEFSVKNCIIKVSGASSASVYIKEDLFAKASGASTIKVKGKPTQKSIITTGASKVKFRD